jgi:hypothetical protein
LRFNGKNAKEGQVWIAYFSKGEETTMRSSPSLGCIFRRFVDCLFNYVDEERFFHDAQEGLLPSRGEVVIEKKMKA